MQNFDKIIEEISNSIYEGLPSLSDGVSDKKIKDTMPKINNAGKKRNENDQSKVAGKYFKDLGNSEGKVVSDEDKKKNTKKGSIKRDLNQNNFGYSKIMSKNSFDKLFNDSGERSLNLSDDGEWKSLNSKTGEYKAKKLSNGKIKLKKVRPLRNQD